MARTKVQSELIATNAISGTIIADGAITSTHLAANCVDSSELVTGSIDTIHIAANQVTATKIVTNGVLTRHISDDQVTAAKLANSINTDIATGPAALPKAGGTMTGTIASFTSTGIDDNADATAITIDSSENVMIGKTAANNTTAGTRIHPAGYASFTIANDYPIIANRLSSDGDIQRFRKDGADIGSIGTANSGDLYIGNDDTTLLFAGGSDAIIPRGTAGATRDGAISLGLSSHRFNNLHLSGTANAGAIIVDVGAPSSSDKTLGLFQSQSSRQIGFVWDDSASTLGISTLTNHSLAFHTNGNSSERMRITNAGNVGIGTTSPQNKLHIHVDGVDSRMQFTNNSSGTAYADGLWVGHDNTQAYFMQRENHPVSLWTNATKRMIIHEDGRILMNTPDPHNGAPEVLHITTTGASGGYGINIKTASSGGGTMMRFNTTGAIVGQITTSGSATTYHTSSDARLKDITGKARGLEVINKLNPVSYTWKLDGSADEGFIAQEVEKLIPNVVHQNADDDMYSMDYGRITPLLVKAIQEQQTIIQELEARIATLEG